MVNNKKKKKVPQICSMCGNKLATQRGLRAHYQTVHNVKMELTNASQKCPLCDDTFYKGSELEYHISTVHKIPLEHKKLTFGSENDFKAWKSNIEKKTKSFYTFRRSHMKSEKKVTYYTCHRSGVYTPRVGSERKRSMKLAGSNRIGGVCPAQIRTEINKKGQVDVDYLLQHVGHKCEAEKLTLTNSEREALAAKIMSGIPYPQIVQDLRETFDNNTRIGLTTIKDLHNIKQAFNIKADVRLHGDDAESVDLLVEKYRSEDDNPVLWYKPYGQDHPFVGKDDFVLVFMNKSQRELLCKFGDTLMIDSLNGTNPYKIQLTTLMVVDGDFQGFPVAFFWWLTRSDTIFQEFFRCIKEKVPGLKPNIFVSDDSDGFFNAFVKTYNYAPPHKLLCDSQVKRKIKENLNKINNVEKRNSVKKATMRLINELNVEKFNFMHRKTVEDLLNDEETSDFGQFFSSCYSKRPEQWAHCARKKLHLDSNTGMEGWHHCVKSNREAQIRLDSSINCVLECLRLQFLKRLQFHYQNQIPSNSSEIRKRHNLAEQSGNHIQIFEEDSNLWYVSSTPNSPRSTFLDFYQVSLNKVFTDCSCCIRCDQCDICLHKFCCTCADYSISYNMCMHIHLVGMQGMQLPSVASTVEKTLSFQDEESCLFQEDDDSVQGTEREVVYHHFNEISVKSPEDEEAELREQTKESLLQMMGIVSSSKNIETVIYISEMLETMKSHCQALERKNSDS